MRHNTFQVLLLVAAGMFLASANSHALSLELVGQQWNLERGSVFSVDILASDISELNGVSLSMTYPAEAVFFNDTAVTSTFFDTRLEDLMGEGADSIWSAATDTPGIVFLSGISMTHTVVPAPPGPVSLFSIHFRVKGDAPAGIHVLRLSQSSLCNGPAGWGTDVNSNGIYDGGDGDKKESAPLLYSFVVDPRAGMDDTDQVTATVLMAGFEEAPFFVFNVLDSGGTDPGEEPGIDSDNDGVPDDEDGCPNDPDKTEPGTCGCGSSDVDTDNDGIADCRDVLIRPANGETNTSVSPVFEVKPYAGAGTADPDAAMIWQISRNSSFTELVFEYRGPIDISIIQLPDFILDEFTTYFWRISYGTGPGGAIIWEEAAQFTTGADFMTDEDGNGIPDDQDIGNGDVPDFFVSGNAQTVLRSGADGLLYGLVPGEGVEGFDRFKWMDQGYFGTADSWPVAFSEGLLSFRLQTMSMGATVNITVIFSEIMPAGSQWFKTTVLQGVYDYSAHVTFAADGRSATLALTDGGAGDIDGVANGVIVDPGGIIRAEGGDDGTDNDGAGHKGGGSSSTCFIDTCLSGDR